ncbi:hypothetical protein AB2C75_17670, partial [Pseudomonas aeruginosa]
DRIGPEKTLSFVKGFEGKSLRIPLYAPAPSPPACALRPPHSARMLRQNGARGFSGPRMNIFQLE